MPPWPGCIYLSQCVGGVGTAEISGWGDMRMTWGDGTKRMRAVAHLGTWMYWASQDQDKSQCVKPSLCRDFSSPLPICHFFPSSYLSIFLHKAHRGAREERGSQVGKYVVTFSDYERPFIFFLCLSILAREEIVSLKWPTVSKAPKPTAAWYPPHPTKSPDAAYK